MQNPIYRDLQFRETEISNLEIPSSKITKNGIFQMLYSQQKKSQPNKLNAILLEALALCYSVRIRDCDSDGELFSKSN